jgi:hypothetical protein
MRLACLLGSKLHEILVKNGIYPNIDEFNLNLLISFDLIGHHLSCCAANARHYFDSFIIRNLLKGLFNEF